MTQRLRSAYTAWRDRRRQFPSSVAALLLAVVAPATTAHAWTPETQVLIAEKAASISPADLRRQIDKHMHQFKRGCQAPYAGSGGAHFKNGDGNGDLDQRIEAEIQRAIDTIRAHRPFQDIVYQLGVVSHYLADANNPLNTDERDPREPLYFSDFLDYVEGAQDRFAVVFYGDGRKLDSKASVAPLVQRTLDRGRGLYPSIAREYRRVAGPPGSDKFDDKSVAFAVGSIALSNAVSDVGAALRYIWLESGGGDERELPTTSPTGAATP